MNTNANYQVEILLDVVYGHARGYWTSMRAHDDKIVKTFARGYFKTKQAERELAMDIYLPVGAPGPRPLIMFMHGGAFYYGDKNHKAFRDFCVHFASKGFVTASINYRLGFRFKAEEILQAEKNGTQDALTALNYLTGNADKYGIDCDKVFVGGSSAGAVIALNLAYMPGIEQYGFRIRAVANLWGYMRDTSYLQDSHTSIISFHGDADGVVPMWQGYPMDNLPWRVRTRLLTPVFGSAKIDEEAWQIGLKSKLHIFEGAGHALNQDKKHGLSPNQEVIKSEIEDFFLSEMKEAE